MNRTGMSSTIVQNVRFIEIIYRQVKIYPLGLRTLGRDGLKSGRYGLIRISSNSIASSSVQVPELVVAVLVQFSVHAGGGGGVLPGVLTSPAKIGTAIRHSSTTGA
jgi:hypothetical protein